MPEVERVAVAHSDADAALPGTIPYELYEVDRVYIDGGEFHEPHYREAQSALLAAVVSKEGPIHLELATERVLAAWGRRRAGDRIKRAMAEAVTICEARSWLDKRDDFLWPVGVCDVPVRVPVSDRTKRKIGHIPPEEIQACLLLIIRHEVGIGMDALMKVTANVFGFDRTGNDIRHRLLKECEALQQQGAVTNVEGWLSCSNHQ